MVRVVVAKWEARDMSFCAGFYKERTDRDFSRGRTKLISTLEQQTCEIVNNTACLHYHAFSFFAMLQLVKICI